MLYPSAKFDEWLNWWIPLKVIDRKPKVWQLRIRRRRRRQRRRRRRRRTHDPYVLIVLLPQLKKQVRFLTRGQQCNEYIHRVFATIKKYLLSLYRVRVLKPFRISHIKLGPLLQENLTLSHVNNKGADQSAHFAILMRALVICSLASIIAKQLNLSHSKLQASIWSLLMSRLILARSEASSTMRALSSAHCTDVRLYTLRIKIGTRTTSAREHSRYWTCLRFETLKICDAAHIEPAHYPYQTVTIQADRRHLNHATCT